MLREGSKSFMAKNDAGKIHRITIMLTNACNLRCRFCRIWQEGMLKPATLNEKSVLVFVREVLAGAPVTCLGMTGGEPFKEMRKLVRIFRDVKGFLKDRRLELFSITTNGSYPQRVKRFVEALTFDLRKALFFNVSLNGCEKVHNRIQGKTVFKKTVQTIQILVRNGIDTTINYTISPDNVASIFSVYKLAGALGVSVEYEFFTPYNPAYYHYWSKEKNFPHSVDVAWKKDCAGPLQKILDDGARFCNRKQIETLLESLSSPDVEKRLSKRCEAPKCFYFVRATGEIYACPYEAPLGKIQKTSWKEIKANREKILRRIKTKGCHRCLSTMGSLSSLGTD